MIYGAETFRITDGQTPTPHLDFSRKHGIYIGGMEKVREQLRRAVIELTREEIAARVLPNTHSIGQLTLHNAETEWRWIQCVVAKKNLD